ncbi:MAG: ABC transporter permease subunit [Acidimicrobiaceae bacterium]|nr:ABC transporter permease subunit [Acidimicrobiaceae bacterium]
MLRFSARRLWDIVFALLLVVCLALASRWFEWSFRFSVVSLLSVLLVVAWLIVSGWLPRHFYRDVVFVKWLAQLVALCAVIFVLVFLATQAESNLEAKSIQVGYDFLDINPGFKISEGIDVDPATGGRALWVGMVNTIRLAIAGIVLSTAIGVFVGVGRLSGNWLVKRIAGIYVETTRNIPLLVQILIINAVLVSLPSLLPLTKEEGTVKTGWMFISNKGLAVPRVFIGEGFYQWMMFVLLGVAVGYGVKHILQRRKDKTGCETYPVIGFVGLVGFFGIIGWWIHPMFAGVGSVFAVLSSFIDSRSPSDVRYMVSALAIVLAVVVIVWKLRMHSTPMGLGKLSENDYFQMIFAVISAGFAIYLVSSLWPGLASWIHNSTRDLFDLLADKFGGDRTGQPIDAMRPNIEQPGKFPNYGPSGLNFSRGLASIYFGVVLYSAGFIAEVVRGGILAVPKGQTEAALAIGLRKTTMLRRVILPQALRVILPPLGNQYLNLAKNTSLAIAVGYSDVVQVGQTLYNQTGRTLEVVSLWMCFYLACSLSISVVVNFFNLRLKIVER